MLCNGVLQESMEAWRAYSLGNFSSHNNWDGIKHYDELAQTMSTTESFFGQEKLCYNVLTYLV
jgi:hypothetical protein